MKVLKVGAVWCSGCIVMKPRWAEIEKQIPTLKTKYYDFDEHKRILEKYNITNLPCFIFLDKNNKEISRLTGEINKEEILKLIGTYKDK